MSGSDPLQPCDCWAQLAACVERSGPADSNTMADLARLPDLARLRLQSGNRLAKRTTALVRGGLHGTGVGNMTAELAIAVAARGANNSGIRKTGTGNSSRSGTGKSCLRDDTGCHNLCNGRSDTGVRTASLQRAVQTRNVGEDTTIDDRPLAIAVLREDVPGTPQAHRANQVHARLIASDLGLHQADLVELVVAKQMTAIVFLTTRKLAYAIKHVGGWLPGMWRMCLDKRQAAHTPSRIDIRLPVRPLPSETHCRANTKYKFAERHPLTANNTSAHNPFSGTRFERHTHIDTPSTDFVNEHGVRVRFCTFCIC